MMFDKVTPEFKAEFDKLVSDAGSILITSHMSPDDDSIGSVLSIKFILLQNYSDKKIDMYYSGEINNRWKDIKGFDQIKTTDDISNIVSEYDLVILLDISECSRASKNSESFIKNMKDSICIDHHENKPSEFNLLLKVPSSPSNSNLIYQVFCESMNALPYELVEPLLLGILGDTGNLEYIDYNQSYVFPIVERLVREGKINIQRFKARYMTIPIRVFNIIKEFVKNSQVKTIPGWPSCLYSYLEQTFISDGKYTDIEISSASRIFIDIFGKRLDEAPWSITAKPHQEEISFGVRSRPESVNVRKLMEDLGIGSGHDRAAGGRLENKEGLSSEKSLNKIFVWMEDHQPVLN